MQAENIEIPEKDEAKTDEPTPEKDEAKTDEPAPKKDEAKTDEPAPEKDEAKTDEPAPEKDETKTDEPAPEKDKAKPGKKKRRPASVGVFPKKLSIVILVLEFLLLAGITVVFVRYSHVDYQKSEKLAKKSDGVEIHCSDGKLEVENVSAKVPSTDNVQYSIAYTWAEGDKDYPTVPYAAVASYTMKGEDGAASGENMAYEISMYRESYAPSKKIPKGKTADNWFSGWKEDGADGIVKKRLDSGKIHGFLVSNLDCETLNSDYRSYTYTFAVSDRKGLSVYVLEGNCYDGESHDEFRKIMNDAVASISVNKDAGKET